MAAHPIPKPSLETPVFPANQNHSMHKPTSPKTTKQPDMSHDGYIHAEDLCEGDVILDAGVSVKVSLLERYPSIKTLMIMGHELRNADMERFRFVHNSARVLLVQSHAEGTYVREPDRPTSRDRSARG